MHYKYANQKEVTELHKWCMDVLFDVQRQMKDFFTFDIRLIGSGEKRLVTQTDNGCFDLDYNLILQKDKKDLVKEPHKIKDLFRRAFDRALGERVQNYKVSDSTSVITNKVIEHGKLAFKFDVAIVIKANDDSYYRLINDKPTGRYLWNEAKHSKHYLERYRAIKERRLFQVFKNRYLELKNLHANDDVKSFSVFLETLHEFEN